MKYYHGGLCDLEVILPPSQTEAKTWLTTSIKNSTKGNLPEEELIAALICADRNRVFITTDLVVAKTYATGSVDSGYAAVYEVRPSPDLSQGLMAAAGGRGGRFLDLDFRVWV